jgi:hypothetical protein
MPRIHARSDEIRFIGPIAPSHGQRQISLGDDGLVRELNVVILQHQDGSGIGVALPGGELREFSFDGLANAVLTQLRSVRD